MAEPNNLAGQLVRTSVSAKSDPEALASSVHFYATCEAGKSKLGEGDNSVEISPWLFRRGGAHYRGLLSLRQDIPAVAAVLIP